MARSYGDLHNYHQVLAWTLVPGILAVLTIGLLVRERPNHQPAVGTLAAVNAVGDFASSFVVGLLWSAASPSLAFGSSGVLFLLGSVLILGSR